MPDSPVIPYSDDTVSPEIAFAQYQQRSEDQLCQVCNQPAVGFHHRAYVCEACKKFFMRHAVPRSNGRNNIRLGVATSPGSETKLACTSCPLGGKCRVIGPGRGKCAHCRYKKCIEIGMSLMSPKENNSCKISKIPCRVCGGASSGFHFGSITCEGCKGFFRRTILSNVKLECTGNGNCPITPANRNICKSCRLDRCFRVGMSKDGSRIGRQPNAIKYFCAKEISQISTVDGSAASVVSHNDERNYQESAKRNQINQLVQSKEWMNLIKKEPWTADFNENLFVDTDTEETQTPEKKAKNNFTVVAVALAAKATLAMMEREDSEIKDAKRTKIEGSLSPSPESTSSNQFQFQHSTNSELDLDEFKKSWFVKESENTTVKLSSTSKDMNGNECRSKGPFIHSAEKSAFSLTQMKNGEEEAEKNGHSYYQNLNPTQVNSRKNETNGVHFYNQNPFQGSQQQFPLEISRNFETNDFTRYPNNVTHANIDKNNLPISVETCFSSYLDVDIDEGYMEMLRLRIPHDIGRLNEKYFYSGINDASKYLKEEREVVSRNLLGKTSAIINENKSVQVVWDNMMFHFETHSRFIVKFVKRIPGFNYLSLDDKRQLVREAMYPVMLMELSKDFNKCQWLEEYNYFDFTLDERKVILQKFPTFKKFTVHLLQSGRIIQRLNLSDVEMTYLCALEIFRAHQKSHCLNDVDSCRYLYLFSLKSLCQHLTYLGKNPQERLVALNQLSPILEVFNREHHEVIAKLKTSMPHLNFPELYTDMFCLTTDEKMKMAETAHMHSTNNYPLAKSMNSFGQYEENI